jgi:hypothetical protein
MAWQTLAGVVEWWADEGLRDLGRQRFHQGQGTDTKTMFSHSERLLWGALSSSRRALPGGWHR